MIYLNKLQETLKQLPQLLDNVDNWDSLIVNKRKPHTYRVFHFLPNGDRVCLHRFETCHTHEAFAHPHPWPGAFIILKGKYNMEVGSSIDQNSNPQTVANFILNKHSSYEIVNPLTWHAVVPLETTYTIMINGPAFGVEAHKAAVTTKGKDLDKMPADELVEYLNVFKNLVNEYLNHK